MTLLGRCRALGAPATYPDFRLVTLKTCEASETKPARDASRLFAVASCEALIPPGNCWLRSPRVLAVEIPMK